MNILKTIYRKIPLSTPQRDKIRKIRQDLVKHLPYAFQQPNPALRKFGTVQDLYPWVVSKEIDTKLFIQNFYSVYYPKLKTDTTVEVWCYDKDGLPLDKITRPLAAFQTLEISMQEWITRVGHRGDFGSLMWHIVLPKDVAKQPECKESHAYFTDRSYFAFVKNKKQFAFMHGIDRYAVFQKDRKSDFDYFYTSDSNYSWIPEIPFGTSIGGDQITVMTLNRTNRTSSHKLVAFDSNQKICKVWTQDVPHRGVFSQTIDKKTLQEMGEFGSVKMTGLTTPWSRLLILVHYPNGAISAMHC